MRPVAGLNRYATSGAVGREVVRLLDTHHPEFLSSGRFAVAVASGTRFTDAIVMSASLDNRGEVDTST